MFSHQGLVETSGNRMPWMLVREMIADPRGFEPSGRRALHGVTYDLIRRSETTLWVHPETSLIHAVSWRGESLADAEIDVMRAYTDYFEHEGVPRLCPIETLTPA